MKQNEFQPSNLDEAVDFLVSKINDLTIKFLEEECSTERIFLSKIHHFIGMNIRNNWLLWWSKKGAKEYEGWPKEKPAIVQYFNDLGIYHADDMSGIIFTTLYRKYFNKSLYIKEQTKKYINYWKNKGIDIKADFEKE